MENQERINQIKLRIKEIREATEKLKPVDKLHIPEVQSRYADYSKLVSEEMQLQRELEELEKKI